MRLIDLLQLTADLNQQTKFFLTFNRQTYPLARLKIYRNSCLLYPGKQPMTKAKIIQLVKSLHGLSIPLYLQLADKQFALYGVQVSPTKNAVYLK